MQEFEFWPRGVQTMFTISFLNLKNFDYVLCNECSRWSSTKFLHFQRWEKVRWLYQILQNMYMMTIFKKRWMTCFLFKEIPFFLQTTYSMWDLYNQSSFTNYKQPWIPCYLKINRANTSLWFKYDDLVLSHLTNITTFRCSLF